MPITSRIDVDRRLFVSIVSEWLNPDDAFLFLHQVIEDPRVAQVTGHLVDLRSCLGVALTDEDVSVAATGLQQLRRTRPEGREFGTALLIRQDFGARDRRVVESIGLGGGAAGVFYAMPDACAWLRVSEDAVDAILRDLRAAGSDTETLPNRRICLGDSHGRS